MRKSTAFIFTSMVHWSCSNKTGSGDERGSAEAGFSSPADDTGTSADGGASDTGSAENHDSGDPSGGAAEGGSEDDAGSTGGDADFPLEGIGTITGDCNVLNLPGDAGLWVQNEIDFGSEVFDEALLSDGGSALFEAGTLGGSSILSEVTAFEVLHRCEIAFLLKTEGEVAYIDAAGKKTDMLVEIDGQSVGVSVTRAYKWGEDPVFTEEDAHNLLSGKLEDVLLSGANAAETNPWNHAILHVIAHDPSYLESLESAYATLPTSLTSDTIVVITVTNGDDGFLY